MLADDRRDPNWLDWSECQEARVAAEKSYKELPAGTPHAKKMLALKEWLLIALHTCMPPDRVVRTLARAQLQAHSPKA